VQRLEVDHDAIATAIGGRQQRLAGDPERCRHIEDEAGAAGREKAVPLAGDQPEGLGTRSWA
jgi:hypothetical protein